MEELIDVPTVIHFAESEWISERIPGDTTVLAFLYLLKTLNLNEQTLEIVKAHLKQRVWP
jgi:IS5 family transposase